MILENLKTKVFNKNFNNPLGLAAGFDKNAEAIEGLLNLGFGFVELGTVTPMPQKAIQCLEFLKYLNLKQSFKD